MLAPFGICSVVAGLALFSAPAFATTVAGRVDVQAACEEQYNDEVVATELGSGAFDWVCFNDSPGCQNNNNPACGGPVDIDRWCKLNYGGGAFADAGNGGIYDWVCLFP